MGTNNGWDICAGLWGPPTQKAFFLLLLNEKYDQFCALGTSVQRVTNTHFQLFKVKMWTFLAFIWGLQAVQGQQISGYGPVDVAELNPLTLNWNQVRAQKFEFSRLNRIVIFLIP